MRWLLLFLCSSVFATQSCDVVVYGGTPAGVIAAVEIARSGKTALLIEPRHHLGGMTTSGLGFADFGKKYTIGGLAREFFNRLWHYYGQETSWTREPKNKGALCDKAMWTFEPHVAEKIFCALLGEAKVSVVYGERLNRRKEPPKKGGSLLSIEMESGAVYEAKVFIDATYEGDLMAASNVEYTIGREANSQYGETLNGVHPNVLRGNMPKRIDPYRIKGDPQSGLLPRVHPYVEGSVGEADRGVQAYNYRMCLTDEPDNRIAIEKPEDYDEKQYELIFRAIEAGLPKEHLMKFDRIPNRKTDSNNCCGVSTDYVGMSWPFAEADYPTREKIEKAHEHWQRGLLWTLQHHRRVPQKMRNHFRPWGLAKDEFADNGHWPYQLYIRESRRMVSDTVITEHTALGHHEVKNGVALASYSLDSHAIQYIAAPDGYVATDGCFYRNLLAPFPISYGALVPKKQSCQNLIVPVCLSSSHVAYGSIRMESVFMMLGHAAGAAASLAIDLNLPVQDIPYEKLKEKLVEEKQVF